MAIRSYLSIDRSLSLASLPLLLIFAWPFLAHILLKIAANQRER